MLVVGVTYVVLRYPELMYRTDDSMEIYICTYASAFYTSVRIYSPTFEQPKLPDSGPIHNTSGMLLPVNERKSTLVMTGARSPPSIEIHL